MVLLGQSLLLLIVPLSVKLPSPNNQAISESYNYLFSGLWKVFFSSNIAVGLSYFFNSALNSKLKIWLLGRRKFTRFIFANGISKAILVFVSYPINFAGIMNWSEILTICINTWMFKMSIAVFAIYLVNPLVRLNHIIDHIDVYDIDTSYNPLRLYEERFQGINMYEK